MSNEEIREHALALIDYCDGNPVQARCGDSGGWIDVAKAVPCLESYSQLRRKPATPKRLMKHTELPFVFMVRGVKDGQTHDVPYARYAIGENFPNIHATQLWSIDGLTWNSFLVDSEVAG